MLQRLEEVSRRGARRTNGREERHRGATWRGEEPDIERQPGCTGDAQTSPSKERGRMKRGRMAPQTQYLPAFNESPRMTLCKEGKRMHGGCEQWSVVSVSG
uniref:Uncharacterized protein n=1 Tax=Setaria digitata TaxID=48799 RepID=A0A915Q4L6_9BILA